MSANGSLPPHATEIVQQLRKLIEERHVRLAELNRERDRILGELKVYEQAIKPLTGEQPRKRGRKPSAQPVRPAGGTRIGPERVEELKEFLRHYDREEFRQVDVRAAMGQWSDGAKISSSSSASAFETLRQEPHNFLRIARVDGNSKYYRLTREALSEVGR